MVSWVEDDGIIGETLSGTQHHGDYPGRIAVRIGQDEP
jgi:hypothetical protein